MNLLNGLEKFFQVKQNLKNTLILSILSLIVSSILMGVISPLALIVDSKIIVNAFLEAWGIFYLLIFSGLSGLALSMFFFKLKQTRKLELKEGIFASLTGLSALITSACPICSSLLLTLLGLTGSFAFLPFNGWEIRVLSLLLVVGTIIVLTQEINECKECEIEEKNSKNEKDCCK